MFNIFFTPHYGVIIGVTRHVRVARETGFAPTNALLEAVRVKAAAGDAAHVSGAHQAGHVIVDPLPTWAIKMGELGLVQHVQS